MKKTLVLAMTGIALLFFTNSQVFAMSYELSLDDDMGEGISLSEKKESTVSYKYDNSLPDAGEFVAEGVFISNDVQDDTHYIGDNSILSIQHLMTDGICMETLSKSIVVR